MEYLKDEGTTDGAVKYSIVKLQKIIVNPTTELIEKIKCSPLASQPQSLKRAYYSLQLHKEKLIDLQPELNNNESFYDEKELKEVISKMERNVYYLEEILKEHKDSIQKECLKIDLSKIKAQFPKPKDFDLLMENITMVYNHPSKNLVHGKLIRSTLEMLANMQQNSSDSNILHCIEERKADLAVVEERINLLTGENRLHDRDELIKFRDSLINLLKMCNSILFFKTKCSSDSMKNIVKYKNESQVS